MGRLNVVNGDGRPSGYAKHILPYHGGEPYKPYKSGACSALPELKNPTLLFSFYNMISVRGREVLGCSLQVPNHGLHHTTAPVINSP